MDRRKFLKIMGAAGAMSALPLKFGLKGLGLSQAWAVTNSPRIDEIPPRFKASHPSYSPQSN